MKVQHRLFTLFIILFGISGCATKSAMDDDNGVPFHIWQHKMDLPTANMAAFAVTDQTLLIRYRDDTRLAVSLVDFRSEAAPEDISLKAYMAQLYGNAIPTDPQLKEAKNILDKDLISRDVLADQGLTIYHVVYEGRRSAIVLDSNSDRFYLMIDAEERSLEPILETITRR